MTSQPASVEELDRISADLERWMAEQVADNPMAEHWERIPGDRRWWFLRVTGEAKDVYTIRWHLQQRTLSYETYFLPAPEADRERFYAHLLARNAKMYGGAFCIGEEEAIFIAGQIDLVMVGPDELDRILGSVWTWVEQYFLPAVRIGWPDRFAG